MTDPRTCLGHNGVATVRLEGLLAAERYVPTLRRRVISPVAPLRRSPRLDAEQLSQLLFGEVVEVLEETGGYAFAQSGRDGYVGFVDTDCLAAVPVAATSDGGLLRVAVLRTYAFSDPSIKSLPEGLYSLNALIEPETREGRFVKAKSGGWFIAEHLAPLGQFDPDPVAVAERFLGTPYLWGGNESLGLDCSGLVQQALRACGMACPRDSDQQMVLGVAIDPADGLARGDLIFWRGHVGFIAGENLLLHANGHHMAVVLEPLDEAIRRIEAAGSGLPTGYRRIA
jgi:cell wall-associated NlpC family hydrolase